MLFAFVWSYILGWLCKKGYSSISWFLVAFPYIVIALAALRIAYIDQHRVIFRSVGLQGAYGEEAMCRGPGQCTDEEEGFMEGRSGMGKGHHSSGSSSSNDKKKKKKR